MMMNWSSLQAVAWSVVLTLAAFGCATSNEAGEVDPCLTALRINLEVGDGAVINEVEYEISGNSIEPIGGTINTSAPGSTASFETFGLPPGEGYIVMMVATSVDGTLTCGGAATFDVGVGVSTEVDVILHCKGSERFGGVRVNGKLNICAELDKVIVAPLQTASGYAASDRERVRPRGRRGRNGRRGRLLRIQLDGDARFRFVRRRGRGGNDFRLR
jgi:hypothetical protein